MFCYIWRQQWDTSISCLLVKFTQADVQKFQQGRVYNTGKITRRGEDSGTQKIEEEERPRNPLTRD